MAVIAAVAVGAVGATRALWTSSVSVTGSTFVATDMKLKIDANPSSSVYQWESGFAAPAGFATNLYPGSHGEQILDLKNEGTVPGTVSIKLTKAAGQDVLANNLTFHIYYDGNHTKNFVDTGISGTLAAFTGTYPLGPITGMNDDGTGINGTLASVKIVWSIPASAGDDIKNTWVNVDTEFGLDQVQTIAVVSSVLAMSSTGAGGWSCPTDHPIVASYTLTTDNQTIAAQGIFKSGATVGGHTWPAGIGYTYQLGEEGVLVFNGVTPQNVTINLQCQAK